MKREGLLQTEISESHAAPVMIFRAAGSRKNEDWNLVSAEKKYFNSQKNSIFLRQ